MIIIIFRTDLALEATNILKNENKGLKKHIKKVDDITITEIEIIDESIAKKIGKPIGTYITIELPKLTDDYQNIENKTRFISKEIKKLLPKKGLILVVGLGNSNITPDALGPKTIDSVLATRHITGEIAKSSGLDNLRPVAALAPGVLGQTGIEVSEIILSVAKNISPSSIIIIDALASKETKRLGRTIQISNTGISPGSGVGNSRPAIDKNTIGIPVISIGVPTVVDAITLVSNIIPDFNEDILNLIRSKVYPKGEPMMVTPREVDLLIERASKLIAMSINCALHEKFSYKDLFEIVT